MGATRSRTYISNIACEPTNALFWACRHSLELLLVCPLMQPRSYVVHPSGWEYVKCCRILTVLLPLDLALYSTVVVILALRQNWTLLSTNSWKPCWAIPTRCQARDYWVSIIWLQMGQGGWKMLISHSSAICGYVDNYVFQFWSGVSVLIRPSHIWRFFTRRKLTGRLWTIASVGRHTASLKGMYTTWATQIFCRWI